MPQNRLQCLAIALALVIASPALAGLDGTITTRIADLTCRTETLCTSAGCVPSDTEFSAEYGFTGVVENIVLRLEQDGEVFVLQSSMVGAPGEKRLRIDGISVVDAVSSPSQLVQKLHLFQATGHDDADPTLLTFTLATTQGHGESQSQLAQGSCDMIMARPKK